MDRTNDDVPAEGFDQTNDMVQGLEGESDETAEGELRSAGERGDDGGDAARGNSGAAPAQETAGGYPANMP